MDFLAQIVLAMIFAVGIWILIAFLWRPSAKFLEDKLTYIDTTFIVAYFVQQFVLVLLLKIMPDNVDLWVGLFALIVITTASLQKLQMDGRDKALREQLAIQRNALKESKELNKEMIEKNEILDKMFKETSERLEAINNKIKNSKVLNKK